MVFKRTPIEHFYISYAKKLFDERFATKGRSIELINNIKIMNMLPLATESNLNLVIQHLGKLVNLMKIFCSYI